MFRSLFSKRGSRKGREATVHAMVAAMNSLDYDAMRSLMTEDAVVVDAGGRRVEGLEAILKADREFREQAGRPEVVIDTLDHARDEVLVRAHMNSEMLEVAGPLMWRAQFEGSLIKWVEVTRPGELMSAPRHAAQRQNRIEA